MGINTWAYKIKNAEGFKLVAIDSLYKVFKFKRRVPTYKEIHLYSARNEYEAFQVLLYEARKSFNNIEIVVEDLLNSSKDSKIASSFIKVREIGYVPTKKPYYRTLYVGLWPDPLFEKDRFSLVKGSSLALWVSIYVPPSTLPGEYKGSIKIISGNYVRKLPITLYVWDFTLPKESHLKTAFDFYEHFLPKFYTRKKREDYQEWKRRLQKIREAFYLMMLEYRISPILNLDPLSRDFNTRLAKYLKQGLNAFGIGKFGGSFGNNWPRNKDSYIISLYRRYAEVLRRNGTLNKAYVYSWDEGEIGNPRVKEIIELIHRADPKLKNMVCYHGFWDPDKYPEWGKDIDIWCFQIANYNEVLRKKLEKLGIEIWMYVSGPDSIYPNFALDFPAISARIIPWLCWKYDIKGLLYWCVNFWRVNPFKDAMNTHWQQNGNGLLLYPGREGPIASLRLELIRDGIEDYEYLYLLKELYQKVPKENIDKSMKKKIEKLLSLKGFINSLSDYNENPQVLYKKRKEIAEAILYLKGNNILSSSKGRRSL